MISDVQVAEKASLIPCTNLSGHPNHSKWSNKRFIFTVMSNIDLQINVPVQKNEKIETKKFQNFWPTPETP